MTQSEMDKSNNPNIISEYLKNTNLTGKNYEVRISLYNPTKIDADYMSANTSGNALGTLYYEEAHLPKDIR